MNACCPACQGATPPGARFCAFCGMSLRECPTCGEVMPGVAEFCGECGTSIVAPEVDDEPRGLVAEEGDIDQSTLSFEMSREDILGFLYEVDLPDQRLYLREGELTIGAGEKNDLVIDKPAVSWNHALIIARPGRIRIQDSASTNGTFVNDIRLTRPRDLRHGDVIRFGNVRNRLWLKPTSRDSKE